MEAVVETPLGRLKGSPQAVPARDAPDRTVVAFRGIPYAAAPIGELRFRVPQPPIPWTGVRDAVEFGPSAMQSKSSLFSGGIPGNQVGEVSEDCLTLNVWTPSAVGNRPVLVWVAGGAFLTGGTCIETYNCARLAAEHDVVVVSVNYRMGAFGFLWVDDGDANCGLRDQLAAVSWVREHVAAFGGDPANITLFGESAGAGSLIHLLSSPDAAAGGLARRCILQSPGVDHTLGAGDAKAVLTAVLAQLGLDPGEQAKLRQVTAEVLLDAQEKAVLELMGSVSSMAFHPYVDGTLLTAKPSVAFAGGAASGLDLLVTWTADEMRLYPNAAANEGDAGRLAEWTRRLLTRRMGHDPGYERAAQLVRFYEDAARGSKRATRADMWTAIQTDGIMRLPARRAADDHAANGGRTYVAQFDWGATGGAWERGAFHAIDLPFTFGTLDRCGWRDFLGIDDETAPGADGLAEWHMAAWANFARDGDPAVGGHPDWPAYRLEERATMRFGTEGSVTSDPLGEIAQAWDGLWSPEGGPPA